MNKLTCHGKPKGFIHFMPKASEKKRLAKQESTDKERSPYEVQFYFFSSIKVLFNFCILDKITYVRSGYRSI